MLHADLSQRTTIYWPVASCMLLREIVGQAMMHASHCYQLRLPSRIGTYNLMHRIKASLAQYPISHDMTFFLFACPSDGWLVIGASQA